MAEGFSFQASWIVFSYSVGTCLGSLLINPLLRCFPKAASVITIILLILEFCCLFVVYFIDKEEENLRYFILLFGLVAVFFISPFSRSASSEVTDRTENERENYLVINSMVVRELLAALFFLLIGNLMEMGTINFLYILMGNALISIILHIIRRIKEGVE